MRKDSKFSEKDFIELSDLENVHLILSREAFIIPAQGNEFFRRFNKNKDKLNIEAAHNLFFNAAFLASKMYVFTKQS